MALNSLQYNVLMCR